MDPAGKTKSSQWMEILAAFANLKREVVTLGCKKECFIEVCLARRMCLQHIAISPSLKALDH
jgi:hypothetical protein